MDKFLLKLKHIRDQLSAAGIKLSDDDIIIAALNGLLPKFDVIKTVLEAQDTPVSLKDFRAYLFSAKKTIESRTTAMHPNMTGLLSVDCVSSSHTHSPAHHQFSAYPIRTLTVHPLNPTPQSTGSHGFKTTAPQSPLSSAASHQPFTSSGHASTFSFRGRSSTGRFSSTHRGSFGPRSSFNFRHQPILECQIRNKRGHTTPNCYYRILENSSSHVFKCHICGKKCLIALNCYHRSNYAYQGTPPPPSL